MNGLRVSSRLFQDHLARILRAGGFEQSTAEKCLFIHHELKVVVTVHVDDPIVAVKESPAWSREAQVFLGANFSRLQMQIDGVMKDVIIEGSRPGYFKNTLIQAGMERGGSAVGAAGVKLATTREDDEYIGDESHKIYRSVCGRLQFASPRRLYLLFTLKELSRGLARPTKGHWRNLMRYLRGSSETVLVPVSERTAREVLRAQADSDWAGSHNTRRGTSCGMIWWGGVLISSYAWTHSTIAALNRHKLGCMRVSPSELVRARRKQCM
eukprot:3003792-Amphidinium_carterae.3